MRIISFEAKQLASPAIAPKMQGKNLCSFWHLLSFLIVDNFNDQFRTKLNVATRPSAEVKLSLLLKFVTSPSSTISQQHNSKNPTDALVRVPLKREYTCVLFPSTSKRSILHFEKNVHLRGACNIPLHLYFCLISKVHRRIPPIYFLDSEAIECTNVMIG